MKHFFAAQITFATSLMLLTTLTISSAMAEKPERREKPHAKQHSSQKTPVRHARPPVQASRRFHPIGHRVSVLPKVHLRVTVGGVLYFYHSGVYYRPADRGYFVVAAPIGALVKGLPIGYLAFHVGQTPYYYVNETYYRWDSRKEAYVVVAEPEGAAEALTKATETKLFIYPKKNQSEDQQSKDRYECHRWAVDQADFDPSLGSLPTRTEQQDDYRRAMGACLEARDYTVK